MSRPTKEYRENVNAGCEWPDCDRDAAVYDHEAGTAFCVWHDFVVTEMEANQ